MVDRMPPAEHPAPTRIHLCGPLRVEIAGRRIDPQLPEGRELALFAYLVAHRERALSRHELIEALWPAKLPAAPGAALSTLLSRLRRTLGSPAIEGRALVSLSLPPESWIDLEAAEEAVAGAAKALAAAAPVDAHATAQAAYEIASQPLLPAIDLPWVERRQRYLEDVCHRALEILARSGLSLGGPSLDSGERAARLLIEADPFRETGYALLMEIYASRGRVAEALQVFELLRVLLREELGTGPAPNIMALHQQLLAGADPELETVRPAPGNEPAPRVGPPAR